MIKHVYTNLLIAFVLFLSNTNLQSQPAPSEVTPNIILVFTDDLGYGDIGINGATLISTPNIDRMASEGAQLTHAFSSANICTPSRAGLLTGRYPIRSGLADGVIHPHNKHGLTEDEVTLPEILKEQDYKTAIIGKWHLGHTESHLPDKHGFDYYYGLHYSNDMKPLALYRNKEIIEEPVDQTTLTERYTQEAVQFIEKNQDEPFFIYMAHSMPHTPLFVSENFERQSNAGLYGDVIQTLDWSMGEIFNTLEKLDLDEETLVIFTSDNGPWHEGSAGNLRERKGGASWEGGFRVPLLARWPGHIPEGVTSNAITMNFDLYPTLAKLAGGTVPKDRAIDGKDIWSLFQGDKKSPHEYLYFFNNEEITAVRSQRWKFVIQSYYRTMLKSYDGESHYYHPGLLFDLELDPAERFSFTRDNPEIVDQMIEWLEVGNRIFETSSK
ncbi:MAG: sulfatase [Balneolales bacterium]